MTKKNEPELSEKNTLDSRDIKLSELFKKCILLVESNKLQEAKDTLLQNNSLGEDNSRFWSNLGVICKQLSHYEEARKHFIKGLTVNPKDSELLCNFGSLFLKIKNFSQGIKLLKQSLRLNVKSSAAWNNLGSCYLQQGIYSQALNCYYKSANCDKNNQEAQFNLAWCLLRLGEFQRGFELYEVRLTKKTGAAKVKNIHSPRWHYQNISSKTNSKLCITAEQGFGDTIQFLRLVKLLTQLGLVSQNQIVLHVQPECLSIVKHSFKNYNVVSNNSMEPKDCDYHIPLLSLPYLLKLDPFNIPSQVPYLEVDSKTLKNCQHNFKNKLEPPRLSIGVVWQGSLNNANDYNRSIDLEQFMTIFTEMSVSIIPIVYEPTLLNSIKEWSYKSPNNTIKVIYNKSKIVDFMDTAAIIHQCDCVVSVDTSVAHLAGAMGKKVLMLVPFVQDWRWFRSISHSPWYPTMTLFRQEKLGDWTVVIQKINSYLSNNLLNK